MAHERRWESAAVIGTGMMGPGIALTLAMGGVRPTILSRTAEGAAAGVEKAIRQAQSLQENGLLTPEDATRAVRLITGSTALDEAIATADLVVESAPED